MRREGGEWDIRRWGGGERGRERGEWYLGEEKRERERRRRREGRVRLRWGGEREEERESEIEWGGGERERGAEGNWGGRGGERDGKIEIRWVGERGENPLLTKILFSTLSFSPSPPSISLSCKELSYYLVTYSKSYDHQMHGFGFVVEAGLNDSPSDFSSTDYVYSLYSCITCTQWVANGPRNNTQMCKFIHFIEQANLIPRQNILCPGIIPFEYFP